MEVIVADQDAPDALRSTATGPARVLSAILARVRDDASTGLSPLGVQLLAVLDGTDPTAADHVRAALGPAVESAPDQTVVALRELAPVSALRHKRHVVSNERFPPSAADLAVLAYAVGLLDEPDVDAVLERVRPLHRGGLLRQRIHRLVSEGRLDEAHATAERMSHPWRGHRDVGLHLARAGDVETFFAEWPRLEPRKQTADLVEVREELVRAVARREGWRTALELVDSHRRLGPRYAAAALSAGPVAPYDELERLLDAELAPRLDETGRVHLLVDQLLREVPEAASGDEDPRVPALAERIGALAGDHEVVRARDGELMRLWPLVAEQQTLRRLRALVRTPALRRELSGLLRDLPPS